MALRGVATAVEYYAYNVANGTPATGDSANHIVYIVVDNNNAVQYTGNITEVDSTNLPGLYRISLTSGHTDGYKITVYVRSSTTGVLIHPISFFTENGLIDAAISTRLAGSAYIAPDNSSIAAIKAVTDQITFTGSNINANAQVVSDKSGYSLASSEHTSIQSDVTGALSAQGYTSTRAANLDNLDAAVSTRSTLTASQVWSYSDRQLTAFGTNLVDSIWNRKPADMTVTADSFADYLNHRLSDLPAEVWNLSANSVTGGIGNQVKTNLDTTVSSRLSSSDIASIVDAVWDEPRTGHTTVDTFGYYLDTLVSSAGGGGSTWTESEKEQIRYALGIDGTKATPTGNTGWLYSIFQKTQPLSFDSGRVIAKSEVVTDKTGYALTSSEHTTIASNVLNAITGTLGFNSTKVGYIDAAISSRLAASSYQPPPTTSDIATAVWSASSGTNFGISGMGTLVKTNLDAAVSTRLAASSYTAPDNTSIAAIKAKTDLLQFTGNNVHAVAQSVADKSGYSLSSSEYITLWNIGTDNLTGGIGLYLLNNLDVPVSTRSTLSTGQVYSVITGNVGLTPARAGYLDRLDANISSVSGNTATAVWSSASGTNFGSNAMGTLIKTNLDATISSRLAASVYTTPPTVSQIATAVWDEPKSAHTTADTFGYYLDMKISSVSTAPGGTDWTEAEREQIRYALGIDGNKTAPTGNTGWLYSIQQKVQQLAFESGRVVAKAEVVSDKAGYELLTSEHTAIRSDVLTAVTGTLGFNATKVGYIDAAISSRLAATSYQAPPTASDIANAVWSTTSGTNFGTSGMGTLLKTNLDVAVSTRLAASAYTAPDNATVNNIWNRVNVNLDAPISSRSTLTAADVWSYSNRQITDMTTGVAVAVWNVPSSGVAAANSIGLYLKNNIDTTISSRSALTTGDVLSVLTGNVGLTSARASNLDRLDVNVSTRSSLTTGDIVSTITGSSIGLTSARVANLDRLDATVSSRLAASSYTAPDNASIAAIKSVTDQISFSGGNVNAAAQIVYDKSGYQLDNGEISRVWNYQESNITGGIGQRIVTNLNATVASRLAAASYEAPDNATISTIASVVNRLQLDDANLVKVRLVASDISIGDWTDEEKKQIRYALAMDGDQQSPTGNSGYLALIKAQTDQLSFVDNKVRAVAVDVLDKSGYTLDATDRTLISEAVWNTTRGTSRASGTFGYYLDARISTIEGGSGGGGWTEEEREQIRYILGIDGAKTEPTDTPSGLYAVLRKLTFTGNTPNVNVTGIDAAAANSIAVQMLTTGITPAMETAAQPRSLVWALAKLLNRSELLTEPESKLVVYGSDDQTVLFHQITSVSPTAIPVVGLNKAI